MLVDNILCNSGVDDISLSCQENSTHLHLSPFLLFWRLFHPPFADAPSLYGGCCRTPQCCLLKVSCNLKRYLNQAFMIAKNRLFGLALPCDYTLSPVAIALREGYRRRRYSGGCLPTYGEIGMASICRVATCRDCLAVDWPALTDWSLQGNDLKFMGLQSRQVATLQPAGLTEPCRTRGCYRRRRWAVVNPIKAKRIMGRVAYIGIYFCNKLVTNKLITNKLITLVKYVIIKYIIEVLLLIHGLRRLLFKILAIGGKCVNLCGKEMLPCFTCQRHNVTK